MSALESSLPSAPPSEAVAALQSDVGLRMRAAYDRLAPVFATGNAALPASIHNIAGPNFLALAQAAAGARPPAVLEAGCGPGRDMAWLEATGALVVGIDLSGGMLAHARVRANGPLVQADLRRLPLAARHFHGAWCNSALLHLPRAAKRRHSCYERTLADLPWAGARVLIHLRVRRFVCRVRWCRRALFAEQLPGLALPFARRTTRLTRLLQRTAFDLGGEPGVRHLAAEGASVGARTLLRLLRATPVPPARAVRVLGMDDWSRRKGRDFGTILVDLERQRVIDLLPDRTAETLAG